MIVYLVYTTIATNWRIGIRRSMNESDTDANTKAIDSLLNFETVKYFGAEGREAARYDRSMARYERLSVKTYVSLAVLNAGQAIIFTIGMVAVLAMCVDGIRSHRNNIGDFVLLNAMMLQLYQPLNFMGMVYRDIKQAIVDIEMMFVILGERPDIADRPGARPLVVSHGAVRFENVDFAYDPEPPHPARRLVRGAGRAHGGDRRPVGRRQVDDLAAAVPLLRAVVGPHHHRRPGHRRSDADEPARRDRHGAAGHGAVQRHHPLQHPLRPRRRDRGGSEGGRARTRRSTPSSARCRKVTARWSASAA